MTLVDEICARLFMTPCQLIGCIRANRLRPAGGLPWRYLRGNATLMALGPVRQIVTPAGAYDIVVDWHGEGQGGYDILQFRGGRWKPWWNEDIELLVAVTSCYTNIRVCGAKVLHELDGVLQVVYLDGPPEPASLAEEALHGWNEEPPKRIRKDAPRAALCRYCPIKSQCDALDLELGQTGDWPKTYKPGGSLS